MQRENGNRSGTSRRHLGSRHWTKGWHTHPSGHSIRGAGGKQQGTGALQHPETPGSGHPAPGRGGGTSVCRSGGECQLGGAQDNPSILRPLDQPWECWGGRRHGAVIIETQVFVQHYTFQSTLASRLMWAPTLFFRGVFTCHAYLRCLSHHPQNPHSSQEAGVPKAPILPITVLLLPPFPWMGAGAEGKRAGVTQA